MKPFLALLLLTIPASAQTTTVTLSSTVQQANVPRIGINIGGGQTALSYYGPNQLFKNLNYAQGGDMPGFYWASTFECSPGSNTVYNWSNNIPNDYPANFWVGADFHAISKTDGSEFGTGTVSISASGGYGTNFSLGAGISRACNASAEPPPTYIPWGDVLVVRALTPSSAALALETPNNFYGGFPSSSTWNTTDTAPASSNTIHSLQLLTGTSASFADDAVLKNATNPDSTLAATYVPFINLNGTYTASFKAKCLTVGCTMGVSLSRLSGTVYIPGTSVSPTYNTTAGAGWQTFYCNGSGCNNSISTTFTASETGGQGSGIYYVLSCTGTCLLQDADLTEGSTLAGNTTVFRDAVVSELEKMKPGSLRYMDSSQWCSDVNDEIAPIGNRRWCGVNEYVHYIQGPSIGYDEFLKLCDVVGTDCWISVGVTNQPSDWTTLVNWLSTSGWTSTFASHGHKIYLEHGNEPWNTAAPGYMNEGNGIAYGGTLGRIAAVAKSATGYNSSVIKIVGGGWNTPFQGDTSGGWTDLMMQNAGCTLSARTNCPDLVTYAPYTLTWINDSSVSSTGTPFLDEWAEISNLDSVTTVPSGGYLYAAGSVYFNTKFAKDTYNVDTGIYETNISTTDGNLSTQVALNQLADSVGEGLAQTQHMLLMQRDAHVTAPINFFNLGQYYFNFNSHVPPPAIGMWGSMIALATGPGQAVNSANYERPSQIAMDIINNAIGSNTNLMTATQSGTPTFSYAGGQPFNGYAGVKNTILANAAVPYVNCFAYANNARTNWTTICFNNNLSSTETVTLAGPGAPTGSVIKRLFPDPSNVITDNNEATYVGPSSIPPVVNYPASSATSGTTYVIPAASMIALSYSTSGGTNYNLTVTATNGNVSGTNCSTGAYASGTAIGACTATPNSGYTFSGWSGGGCSGTGTCGLTLTADTAITATFTIIPAAQTWYIQPLGGPRYSATYRPSGDSCNGRSNAAMVTSGGPNQTCAFSDPRYVWADGSAAGLMVMAGGDTLILAAGTTWRFAGRAGPNSTSGDLFNNYQGVSGGDPYTDYNINFPAGTSGAHTRILGSNYASCGPGQKTAIFGGYATLAVINLQQTSYVDVQCLDITDHSSCIKHGTAGLPSICSNSYPITDYANSGIMTVTNAGSSGLQLPHDILLQDLDIHGFPDSGISGAIGGAFTLTRVTSNRNGFAGWNFDFGSGGTGFPNNPASTVAASYVTMDWNGCNEEYPMASAIPVTYCYSIINQGFGDAWSGQDSDLASMTCDHCEMAYNVKDAFFGPHTAIANVSITNSAAYNNGGQTWKANLGSSGAWLMKNTVTNNNCRRMAQPITGAPSTFNTYINNADYCRADGAEIAVVWPATGSFELDDNTFVTASVNVSVDITCWNAFATVSVGSGGSGYTVGDVLYPGGTQARVTVTSVSGGGVITGISLTAPGQVTNGSVPFTENYVFGGTGTGATITVNTVTPLSCGGGPRILRNNNFIGYTNPSNAGWNSSQITMFCYSSCNGNPGTSTDAMWTTRSNNNFYGYASAVNGACTYAGEVCASPLMVVQPSLTWTSETQLDSFTPSLASSSNSFYPASGSPLIGAGVAIGGLTTDYYGVTRPNPPAIGAVEYVAATGGVVKTGNVVLIGVGVIQ